MTRPLLALCVILAGCTGAAPPTPAPTTAGPSPPTDTPVPTAGTASASPSATIVSMPGATATTPSPTPLPAPSATFVVDGERRAAVTLEVADSPAERRRGLMGRESLARNHGMLFVYAEERPLTFWMKDTLIPLDMIFVAANGTVINVAHASVQPNASDAELRRYHSAAPAKYVIEVNRGFANRTGIGPGTRVIFRGNASLLTPEG